MENLAADVIRECIETLKSSLLAELREIRARMGDMECRMGSVEEHLVTAEVLDSDSKVRRLAALASLARGIRTCECVVSIVHIWGVSRSQTFVGKSGYASAFCSCM